MSSRVSRLDGGHHLRGRAAVVTGSAPVGVAHVVGVGRRGGDGPPRRRRLWQRPQPLGDVVAEHLLGPVEQPGQAPAG
nr:hypothetical protein [Angustibacter aerolatus]